MTDPVKELASDIVDDLHALSNFVPTDTFKILLAQRITAALNEAERAGREGMREEAAHHLPILKQHLERITCSCGWDLKEFAGDAWADHIRALPVTPPPLPVIEVAYAPANISPPNWVMNGNCICDHGYASTCPVHAKPEGGSR